MFTNNEMRKGFPETSGGSGAPSLSGQGPCGLLRYSLLATLGIFDISPVALPWLRENLNNLPWEVKGGEGIMGVLLFFNCLGAS